MDDNGVHEVEDHLEPETPRPTAEMSEGIPWGAILLLIWAVVLIIFSVQNAERATVDFLGWSFDMPVALLVMVTALATLVLTGLGFAFYRRKRRKRLEAKQAPESEL